MLVKIAFFTDLEDSTIEFLVETDHDIEKELPELLTGTNIRIAQFTMTIS